jgi:hydrogenase maturation factor
MKLANRRAADGAGATADADSNEGTAILAREKAEELRGRVDPDVLVRAARLLIDPGISVVKAALAIEAGEIVHAMHDPTEVGLATGLFELTAPSGLGLRVVREHVAVLPETSEICKALGLDPLRLIASGALLVAAAPAGADRVLRAIRDAGVPASIIGEVRPPGERITMTSGGRTEPLVPADRDEIARALEAD